LSNDRGTGLVSTIAGVTVFLAFLLFSVQLLLNLYATSVVSDVAYDGARSVAGYEIQAGGDTAVRREMAVQERRMRRLLGGYQRRVAFDWSGTTADSVRLRVRAENPTMLLRSLGGRLPFTSIDRTVVVRVERLQ
jgi:hypothetical protein